MAPGLAPRLTLRFVAVGYLVALVMVPLGMIFYRTFEHGFTAFWEQVTTPASISAIWLSLEIVAIVVPLNVIFGVVTALALARGNFPGAAHHRDRGGPAVRRVARGGRRVADPALRELTGGSAASPITGSGSSSPCRGW